MTRHPQISPVEYCEAKTRAQATSGAWGASKIGCGKRATITTEDGHRVCAWHKDAPYGYNS